MIEECIVFTHLFNQYTEVLLISNGLNFKFPEDIPI